MPSKPSPSRFGFQVKTLHQFGNDRIVFHISVVASRAKSVAPRPYWLSHHVPLYTPIQAGEMIAKQVSGSSALQVSTLDAIRDFLSQHVCCADGMPRQHKGQDAQVYHPQAAHAQHSPLRINNSHGVIRLSHLSRSHSVEVGQHVVSDVLLNVRSAGDLWAGRELLADRDRRQGPRRVQVADAPERRNGLLHVAAVREVGRVDEGQVVDRARGDAHRPARLRRLELRKHRRVLRPLLLSLGADVVGLNAHLEVGPVGGHGVQRRPRLPGQGVARQLLPARDVLACGERPRAALPVFLLRRGVLGARETVISTSRMLVDSIANVEGRLVVEVLAHALQRFDDRNLVFLECSWWAYSRKHEQLRRVKDSG